MVDKTYPIVFDEDKLDKVYNTPDTSLPFPLCL